MQTYWELSEKERAALTREEVEKYLDAELMMKGVLKVRPLELEPLPTVPEPTTKAFEVRRPHAGPFDVRFRSTEDAATFLRLCPLFVNNDYVDGTFLKSLHEIDGDEVEIVAVTMHSKKQLDACKPEMLRRHAVQAENDRRQREHDETVRKQDEALRGVWSDWYECQEKAVRMRRVVETFDDYVRLTGGKRDVAGMFLLKAFARDMVVEAAEWAGIEIPLELAPEATLKPPERAVQEF